MTSSPNAKVNGFNNGSITFDGASIISSLFNQVYFTANMFAVTGGGPEFIDGVYDGSEGDMVCYDGKGNRAIEFTGQ